MSRLGFTLKWLTLGFAAFGFLGCSGFSPTATRELASQKREPGAEKSPAEMCDGVVHQGEARVLAISPVLPGAAVIEGRLYVRFSFTADATGESTPMTLSLLPACIRHLSLAPDVRVRATAWIRTIGECRPYVLGLPLAVCTEPHP